MEELRAAGQCACPPELDEIELIVAADEEASPEIYEHLAACPYCAARVQEISELQGRLQERLYRLFCPTSDELAAFSEDQMVQQERKRIANHLASCPQCRGELAMLQQITAAPLVRPPGPPTRQVVAQPQHASLLWYTNGEGATYRAGALRITLNVERQHGTYLPRLRGAVRGNHLQGITASLIYNGRVVSAAPLDEQGGFVLDEIAPGDFSLSLRLPNCEVIVEALHF